MDNNNNNLKSQTEENPTSVYDDDDIPPIDIQMLVPGDRDDRPRRDGPGGN